MTTTNDSSSPGPDPREPSDPEFAVRAVLGKASDDERRAVEARAAADAATARLVGQLRDVRDAIATAAAEAADLAPRALFERAFALSARLPKVPSWFDRLKAAVLEPIEQGLGSLAQPALRGAGVGLQSFAGAGWRLDAVVERLPSGTQVLRVEVDGPGESLAGEIVALDAASGRVVAEARLDADGACTLPLPTGDGAVASVDLAFRLEGEGAAAGERAGEPNVHTVAGIRIR